MPVIHEHSFRFLGQGVKIYGQAKIICPEVISIGHGSQIDDFTFIYGGQSVLIGNRVHIASFTSVVGGGEFIAEDFCGISTGVRIITGTDKHDGSCLTNPCVPAEYRAVELSKVVIGKHAIIFTNAILMPGVTVGEGAIVAAGALVANDLAPWGIYAGSPCRRVGIRPSETILRMEQEVITKYGF